MFQAMIADGAAGIFMSGDKILDVPTKFSRSDTAAVTDPAAIIKRVLNNMGAADADLDTASFAAATATYATWGLAWNFAFYYTEDRAAILSKLLIMCHSCLVIGDKVKLQVLSKTSQATVSNASVLKMQDVGQDTFKYSDSVAERVSDSGYVAFQQTGESQDQFIKILVPAKTTTTVIDNEVIAFPGVQDTQQVQKLGTLYYQRKFLKNADVSFVSKGTLLALRPDDVITVSYADYGGTYDVLIDEMTINEDASINFSCQRFYVALDDWGDLAPGAITIVTDVPIAAWSPVIISPDGRTTGIGGIGGTTLLTPGALDMELMKMNFQSISWAQFAILDSFDDETKRASPDPSTNDARVYAGALDNGGDLTADKSFGFVSKTYASITTVDSGTATSVGVNYLEDTGKAWFSDECKNLTLYDSAGTPFNVTTNTGVRLTVSGSPAAGAYTLVDGDPAYAVAFASFLDSSNGGAGYVKLEVSFDGGTNYQTFLNTEISVDLLGGTTAIANVGHDYIARITLKNDPSGNGPYFNKFLVCTDPSPWRY
jgi:hypothetical protein